jgi:hypothetical protein
MPWWFGAQHLSRVAYSATLAFDVGSEIVQDRLPPAALHLDWVLRLGVEGGHDMG